MHQVNDDEFRDDDLCGLLLLHLLLLTIANWMRQFPRGSNAWSCLELEVRWHHGPLANLVPQHLPRGHHYKQKKKKNNSDPNITIINIPPYKLVGSHQLKFIILIQGVRPHLKVIIVLILYPQSCQCVVWKIQLVSCIHLGRMWSPFKWGLITMHSPCFTTSIWVIGNQLTSLKEMCFNLPQW